MKCNNKSMGFFEFVGTVFCVLLVCVPFAFLFLKSTTSHKDWVISQDFVKEHHCESQVFTVDEGVLKVQYLCDVDGDEK